MPHPDKGGFLHTITGGKIGLPADSRPMAVAPSEAPNPFEIKPAEILKVAPKVTFAQPNQIFAELVALADWPPHRWRRSQYLYSQDFTLMPDGYKPPSRRTPITDLEAVELRVTGYPVEGEGRAVLESEIIIKTNEPALVDQSQIAFGGKYMNLMLAIRALGQIVNPNEEGDLSAQPTFPGWFAAGEFNLGGNTTLVTNQATYYPTYPRKQSPEEGGPTGSEVTAVTEPRVREGENTYISLRIQTEAQSPEALAEHASKLSLVLGTVQAGLHGRIIPEVTAYAREFRPITAIKDMGKKREIEASPAQLFPESLRSAIAGVVEAAVNKLNVSLSIPSDTETIKLPDKYSVIFNKQRSDGPQEIVDCTMIDAKGEHRGTLNLRFSYDTEQTHDRRPQLNIFWYDGVTGRQITIDVDIETGKILGYSYKPTKDTDPYRPREGGGKVFGMVVQNQMFNTQTQYHADFIRETSKAMEFAQLVVDFLGATKPTQLPNIERPTEQA